MFEDTDTVLAALRVGARGYLLKGANRDQLVNAITAVAIGQVVLGSLPAAHVVTASTTPRTAGPFPTLSDREREVLDLIASGLDNRAIAHRLHLSDKTIRNNVSTILTKLAVPDRSHAIVLAREAGLGTRPAGPRHPGPMATG